MKELVEVAIMAYRAGRYRDAIELLLQATDVDPRNFMAGLYLAMSYHKAGRVGDSFRLMKRISVECPDEHLRLKAQQALPQIEAEMQRRFTKNPIKLTGTLPKTITNTEPEDIVWVG